MPTSVDWLNGSHWLVVLTVAAYAGALALRNKWRWLHPMLTGSITVIVVLLVLDIPYEQYRHSTEWIWYMLGPATVALGVPIYKYGKQLRRYIPVLLTGTTTGAIASIISAWLLAASFGLASNITYSMLPKSVTSPVSLELAKDLGGVPELAAVLTVLTGLLGSIFGPLFLRLIGLRDDLSIGVAIGTSSHGIGTARLVIDSERQGSISALSMSVSCIVTPLLMLPLYWLT